MEGIETTTAVQQSGLSIPMPILAAVAIVVVVAVVLLLTRKK